MRITAKHIKSAVAEVIISIISNDSLGKADAITKLIASSVCG